MNDKQKAIAILAKKYKQKHKLNVRLRKNVVLF